MSRPSLSVRRPTSELADDLLLDFPTPPSFIPPSPSALHHTGPPLSRPPSTPLPPVPGPSPISQSDLHALRLSRGSFGSLNSSRSSRSSSIYDGHSASSNTSVPHARKDSQSSLRSYASASSLAVPGSAATARTPIPHPIRERDEDELAHTSLADVPRLTPSPAPETLRSIAMDDLPSSDDDDARPPAPDPRSLHQQMRAARSKSATHKARLGTRPAPASAPTTAPASPARADSPDVASMLAATPRPRRTSSPPARPRQRVQSGGSTASYASSSAVSRSSLPYMKRASYASRASTEGWNEESFVDDYGVLLSGGDGLRAPDEDEDAGATETASVFSGGADDNADSDSSLDLHTPLPNLMLRHGMLSPNSKLLAAASRAGTPAGAGARPGSTLSTASAQTKSGLYRDDRDTAQRRVRHRDGRLLRGGLGLTTGLGWSDSEDEDAPSALTRRLSSMALSRASSTRSLAAARTPKRPPPPSRSFSTDAHMRAAAPRARAKSSAPPSAFSHASAFPHAPASVSSHASASVSARAGCEDDDDDGSASTSTGSASLRTPDGFELADPPRARPWDREKSLPPLPRLSRAPSTGARSLLRQPSSASLRAPAESVSSSLSTPAPAAPAPAPAAAAGAKSLRHAASSKSLVPKRSTGSLRPPSKVLPAAPPPAAPAPLSAPAPVTPTRRASEPDEQRRAAPRALLTASLSLSNPNIVAELAALPPPTPRTPSSAAIAYHRPGRVSRVASTPTLAQAQALEKPKPRTGTGMVYRTSSGRARAPVRMPSSPGLAGAGYTGAVAI